MRKVTDFIVNKRNLILILFTILAVISIFIAKKVNINYDMAEYLPSNSETRIGMDIMETEFEPEESSNLNLMFKGLSEEEKDKIYKELSEIEEISSIKYDKESKEYNKDDYTLFILNIDKAEDSTEAKRLYNTINEKYKDYDFYTNGSIATRNMTILPLWIIVLAVTICLLILIIMCESYVEPFLFLLCIGIAVLLNNGTNIIFNSVSNITSSIVAILQLALSMDYSIMLMNRYTQEKEKNSNKIEEMKEALYKSFGAISSSSITTIVGLIALVFMSFTIGRDLGLVLAKGVCLCLLVIFTCLPGLILIFDKLITKTKKKTLNFNLKVLGSISYKSRAIASILLLIIFVGSYLLKGNLNIAYTGSENDEISHVFGTDNQIAIIYNNKDEQEIASVLNKINENEKVNQVLGYSNTINEKLTYDNFNDKLEELNINTRIEDYLLKIIYYKYYNNEEERMTFNEFVNFIKNDVLTNENFADKLDKDTISNIDKLSNFTTKENINKKRSYKEIAQILEINENDIYNLFVYYYSQNINIEITITDFVNFLNKDVLTDSNYSDSIDSDTKKSLTTLSKFVNKSTITKSMNAKEMSELFGLDKSQIEQLYLYYYSIYGVNNQISINEFANFVVNNLLNNSEYASLFNKETISKLKLLQSMSDKKVIDKTMTSKELSDLFGLNEDIIKQLLLLKYSDIDNGETLTINEFIQFLNYLKENTNYLDGMDISSINKVSVFAKNENNINTTKMNKDGLKFIFDSISQGLVDKIYIGMKLPESYQFTPQEFVTTIVENLSESLDKTSLNSLKLIKTIIDDSITAKQYTSTQIATIFNIETKQINQVYAIYNYINGNINNWKLSPYQFVLFVLENSNNEQISKNMDIQTLAQLQSLKEIMKSSKNNLTYTYAELSKVIGLTDEQTKQIYAIYASQKTEFRLTPKVFTNFILDHINDKNLKENIDINTVNKLKLINNIMNGVLENKKYSVNDISSLFGLNIEEVKLLYSLYSAKYINTNMNSSLKEFVDFTLNKVITNKKYSSKFNNDTIETLNTINGIMNGSLNETKYLAPEIHGIITKLTNSIEKKTVEILYIYYGSEKYFQNEWSLTLEELINYVNDDILTDERFNDFINQEMKDEVSDSKQMISDSKKMLVAENYSRIVINTKYDMESEETFNFIQSLYDMLEGTESYIIGDSPMAYEMSKTFGGEFNYISILTMIFIFIVVALTFRSILIPLILVLIIQCAVYTTMGILGLFGGSVYFIALLIVQSILMGATIDYAIVYTSYYRESRETLGVKEAIINSYNKSIHTILTSSSILISATFLVGQFSTGIISKICLTISEGVLCSTILILFILPSVLALFDKFIIKRKN